MTQSIRRTGAFSDVGDTELFGRQYSDSATYATGDNTADVQTELKNSHQTTVGSHALDGDLV